MVRNRWGTLRWAMEAKVASTIQPKETPDHRSDSGKKTETRESPAATLEKKMKRIRG